MWLNAASGANSTLLDVILVILGLIKVINSALGEILCDDCSAFKKLD